MSWDLYKVASGLDQKEEKIQVATLLHVLGKECVEIFSNFVWTSEGDRNKIEAAEEKFNDHCAPLTSSCLLYTSPSPRDLSTSRMPSSA